MVTMTSYGENRTPFEETYRIPIQTYYFRLATSQ
jgi:hypothetical protein